MKINRNMLALAVGVLAVLTVGYGSSEEASDKKNDTTRKALEEDDVTPEEVVVINESDEVYPFMARIAEEHIMTQEKNI